MKLKKSQLTFDHRSDFEPFFSRSGSSRIVQQTAVIARTHHGVSQPKRVKNVSFVSRFRRPEIAPCSSAANRA